MDRTTDLTFGAINPAETRRECHSGASLLGWIGLGQYWDSKSDFATGPDGNIWQQSHLTHDRGKERRGRETLEAISASWPRTCTYALSQARTRSSPVLLMCCSCTVFYRLELSFEDSLRTVNRISSLSLKAYRGREPSISLWIKTCNVTKSRVSSSFGSARGTSASWGETLLPIRSGTSRRTCRCRKGDLHRSKRRRLRELHRR